MKYSGRQLQSYFLMNSVNNTFWHRAGWVWCEVFLWKVRRKGVVRAGWVLACALEISLPCSLAGPLNDLNLLRPSLISQSGDTSGGFTSSSSAARKNKTKKRIQIISQPTLNGSGCIPVQRPRRLFQWRIFWSWSSTMTSKVNSWWLIRLFRCIISTCAARPGAGTSVTARLSRAPPGRRRSWTLTTQLQKRRYTSRVRRFMRDSQSVPGTNALLMGGEVQADRRDAAFGAWQQG